MAEYVNKTLEENPPHLYAVADLTLRNLYMSQQNQSLVVSGESGSGKTRAIQLMLSYFAGLGNKDPHITKMAADLLEANKILEGKSHHDTFQNMSLLHSNLRSFNSYFPLTSFWKRQDFCQ